MGFFSNLIDGISGKAAEDAADIVAAGQTDAQGRIEDLITTFFRPGAEQQQDAQNQLAAFLGLRGPEVQRNAFANFQTDPGFEVTQEAGIRAIDQAASAGRQLNSGGRQKALFRFGQQGLNNQFNNRLSQLAGFQNNAQANLFGATQARNQRRVGAANAQAQGIVGGANAATGFVNQLAALGGGLAGQAIGAGLFNRDRFAGTGGGF